MTKYLYSSTYSWFDAILKSFITSDMECGGGGGGLTNTCATASVKLPKRWNALLRSKYLEFGKFISALGS
jgi:hypothetical protein